MISRYLPSAVAVGEYLPALPFTQPGEIETAEHMERLVSPLILPYRCFSCDERCFKFRFVIVRR